MFSFQFSEWVISHSGTAQPSPQPSRGITSRNSRCSRTFKYCEYLEKKFSSFLPRYFEHLNAPLLQEPWRESFQKHRIWGRQPSPLPVIKYNIYQPSDWSINMTPLIGCWPWHPRRSALPSSRSRPRPWGRSCSPPAAWRSRRTHWRRRSGAASCYSSPPENCLNFVRCLLDVVFTRPMSAPSLTSLLTVSSCEVKKSITVCSIEEWFSPGWGWWRAWRPCCRWFHHTGPGHTSSPTEAKSKVVRTKVILGKIGYIEYFLVLLHDCQMDRAAASPHLNIRWYKMFASLNILNFIT